MLHLADFVLWALAFAWASLVLLCLGGAAWWWCRARAAKEQDPPPTQPAPPGEPEQGPEVQPRDGGPRPKVPRRLQ